MELDRVMLRVTSAAMPSSDNKEVGTRLAMQAAALEADNSDPLGLGRIDPRQLTLVSVSAGPVILLCCLWPACVLSPLLRPPTC